MSVAVEPDFTLLSENNITSSANLMAKFTWCVDNKIVNYDHKADKSLEKKYNANYKLKVVDDKILPNYLVKNKNKFKEWFDNSEWLIGVF